MSFRWEEGKLRPSRITQQWKLQSSSLCWTTWCSRSFHTSECHHTTQPGSTNTPIHASLLLSWFASQGILWPRLDEEWQKWEDAVYHEDNEALQWRTLQSKRALITYWTLLSKRNMKSKLLVSRFFCQMSNLIATEILRCDDVVTRVAVIEKWVAVADICRCLHNYNAVLEITSSLNRSSVFRLKKTWLKVSKQVRVSICIAASPWSAWYCHWTCSLSPFFSRLKHWLTNCRSWSHQRGGSKTSERLWRSEFKDIVSDWINKANKQHKWMISGFYSLFFFILVAILPVCPIWGCISLIWLSLRRERRTTPRTTWSTSQRWGWWDVRRFLIWKTCAKFVSLTSLLPFFPDFSHHQRNQTVSTNSI